MCTEQSRSELSPDAKDVLVLVNPTAGARSGRSIVEQTAHNLTQIGYRCETVTDLHRLAELAEAGLRGRSLRTIIAAGGDGTVATVANQTPPGTPITVLPLGTENLLAKYLEIPPDAQQISQIIHHGRTARLDAGRANGRLFLLMAGCGFDAEVVRRVDQARSGHITHFTYAKPILDSIRSYQYPELRIYSENAVDDDQRGPSVVARWAFIANLPRYARGLTIVPQACGRDGLLDVCTFRRGSLFSGLVYLAGVVFGRHQSLDDCVNLQTRRLRIESDGEVPFQLDGDPGGYLPVDIEVVPGRLTLVVPRHRAGGWVEEQPLGKE